MKAKEENGIIKIVELPNSYKGVENVLNGYSERTDLHLQDGFYPIEEQSLNIDEQFGTIYIDSDVAKYNIVKKVVEQIPLEQVVEVDLRAEYSQRISDIVGMKEAIERYIMDYEPIPQNIVDEREAIKAEYKEKLLNQ